VYVAAGHERVLFADYLEVFAFGADGLAWRSGRVAYDDVTLVSVENDKVVVSGFDAPENQIVEFTLDIATGEAHGAPWTEARRRAGMAASRARKRKWRIAAARTRRRNPR
jgi:hypothetical protein